MADADLGPCLVQCRGSPSRYIHHTRVNIDIGDKGVIDDLKLSAKIDLNV